VNVNGFAGSDSWPGGKMQDLMSAENDLERAFDHTATNLHDLANKCEAEEVCQAVFTSAYALLIEKQVTTHLEKNGWVRELENGEGKRLKSGKSHGN